MGTRFFTDPKSGGTYSFGDRLPSDDFNAYLAGWRNFDAAFDTIQSGNWREIAAFASATQHFLAYDGALRMAFAAYTSGGNPVVRLGFDHTSWAVSNGLTAGVGLTVTDIVSNGAGTVVVGGTPGAASNVKVHSSTNGFDWTPRNLATAGTSGVQTLAWDSSNSLFLAGLNGGTTTSTLETSVDGTTWLARTMPTSNTVSSIASDGATNIVAVYSASTTAFAYSSDGVTWSAGTFPSSATWKYVTYCPGQGLWLASDGSSSLLTSTNGISWTAVSSPSWPNAAGPTVSGIASTHNDFLLAVSDTYGEWVHASSNGGSTWYRVCNIDPTGTYTSGDVHYNDGYALAANVGNDVFSGVRVDA